MDFPNSDSGAPRISPLAGERGFVLVGSDAPAVAERVFGSPVRVGQAVRLPWDAGAPAALVILVSPDRLEIRIPDQEPWPARLRERLAGAAGAASFGGRLTRAIARLEAWQESDAESGTGLEDLAAELDRLRQLAPSPESRQAVGDALEALDDGLPADSVAAALYRAGAGPKRRYRG